MNEPTSRVFTLPHLLVIAALAALALAACRSSSDENATPATTSPTSVASSPTSVASSTPPGNEPPATVEPGGGTTTTDDIADPAGNTITIPVVSELPPSWSGAFVIPYGPDEEELGTAEGGDGGSLELGPDYGAQGSDGTWSILDSAKQRIARYNATGRFLDAFALPPEVLVDGVFVQYQLPRVLADGTFVAFGLRPDDTELLVVQDESVNSRRVSGRSGPTVRSPWPSRSATPSDRPIPAVHRGSSSRRDRAHRG